MKRIILMRHAKSDWNDINMTDHQRPLNQRGKTDAPQMAKSIAEFGILPQMALVSTAQRTRETWKLIAPFFGKCPAIYLDELYLSSPSTITRILKNIDDSIDNVLLLAHNPGITETFFSIAGVMIDNVPTCGAGCIVFNCNSFKNIGKHNSSLSYFIYPKMI